MCPFEGEKHQHMLRDTEKIFLPNPHNDSIDVAFLKRILRETNISIGEFIGEKIKAR